MSSAIYVQWVFHCTTPKCGAAVTVNSLNDQTRTSHELPMMEPPPDWLLIADKAFSVDKVDPKQIYMSPYGDRISYHVFCPEHRHQYDDYRKALQDWNRNRNMAMKEAGFKDPDKTFWRKMMRDFAVYMKWQQSADDFAKEWIENNPRPQPFWR